MNNKRRNKLDVCNCLISGLKYQASEITEKLDSLLMLKQTIDNWSNTTNITLSKLNAILEEENDALSSIPDNFQFGPVAWNVENSVSEIESAIEETKKLLDFIDSIEDAYNALPLRQIDYSKFRESLDELKNGVVIVEDYINDAKGL